MRFFGLTLIRSLAVTPVAGDVIRLEVSTDGVIFEDTHHFLKSVRDEDEGDEAGEALLGEARHVLDDVAGVCGHQDQTLETRVQADPEPDLHVVYVIASEHRRQPRIKLNTRPLTFTCTTSRMSCSHAEFIQQLFKDQYRSGRAEDDEGLTAEEAEDRAGQSRAQKAFHHTLEEKQWKDMQTENCDRKDEKTPDLTYVLFLVKISKHS